MGAASPWGKRTWPNQSSYWGLACRPVYPRPILIFSTPAVSENPYSPWRYTVIGIFVGKRTDPYKLDGGMQCPQWWCARGQEARGSGNAVLPWLGFQQAVSGKWLHNYEVGARDFTCISSNWLNLQCLSWKWSGSSVAAWSWSRSRCKDIPILHSYLLCSPVWVFKHHQALTWIRCWSHQGYTPEICHHEKRW